MAHRPMGHWHDTEHAWTECTSRKDRAMTLPNGSASASDRTIACPASLALPRVNRTTPIAERGRGIHRFVEAVLTGTARATALEAVEPEYRETCKNLDWQKLGGDLSDIRCEASYALDPIARTARFLGTNLGRNYPELGPDEVPGSLDIEGIRFDGIPVVQDMKSGFGDTADAEDAGQGLFFGAVKHLMLDAPEVEFRVNRIHVSGQVTVESSFLYTAWEIDNFLDAYAEAILEARKQRALVERGGVPDVNVGDWCKYCHSLEHCPAQTRLARAMLPDAKELEARVHLLTLPEAGEAWTRAHEIRSLANKVIDALKLRAAQEALPSAYGKEVRPIRFERNDFIRDKALELLDKLGATAEQKASLFVAHEIEQIRECNVAGVKRLAAPKKAKKIKSAPVIDGEFAEVNE
jgi:hypothetical protein